MSDTQNKEVTRLPTLRDYMTSAGIATLQSLAIASGISLRSLEQYSSGRYPWSNARAKLIIAVADTLRIHPRDLIAIDQTNHDKAGE